MIAPQQWYAVIGVESVPQGMYGTVRMSLKDELQYMPVTILMSVPHLLLHFIMF